MESENHLNFHSWIVNTHHFSQIAPQPKHHTPVLSGIKITMYNNSTLSNRERKILISLDKMNRDYRERSSHAVEREEYESRRSSSYYCYEDDFANDDTKTFLLNDPSQRQEACNGYSCNETNSDSHDIQQAHRRKYSSQAREGSNNSMYRSIYHRQQQHVYYQDDEAQFSYFSNKNSAITIASYVLLLSIVAFGYLIKEMIQEYDNVSSIDQAV